ncbi:LysR family transcriptional regulator ArgP [Oceanospirillum linum]|uniref:Transcriptional regulator ArgP n=1 Tax=Oceanospirillum linum TaxID=966 RepID=A0A1T1HE34_OCELI|nr:LysR family transcriptional regulator ArgP [Oceanospirillum linum]OOV88128.1 transcriptional regulator ArgP [Oceanospirillum linum]SEF44011.1 LysR family transcriptional regulator, chromosome initiation inhibitor [Oleiphilus messinensis]SMP01506.1 LysR family transcriptional regulator, chromosome initiation inhibitor [Oceanospirillum linum]
MSLSLDPKQLSALHAVIEEQSFDKAAKRLHVTQSAISQRIRQLEEKLGQAVMIRSTPLVLTATGQRVLKFYHQLSLLEGELSLSLNQATEQGFSRMPVAVNADSLDTWFPGALAPLVHEHPWVLDIKIDDQEQTHHLLRTGEVLGCVSASSQAMQGCDCFPLGVMRYRALATPDYIARYFPDGITESAVAEAPVVEFNHKDELQNHFLRYIGLDSVSYPKHRVPATGPYFHLIRLGLGWGMVPDQQSQPYLDLSNQESATVTELAPGQTIDVPLYWHVWNLKSENIRRLTQAVIKGAKKHLTPIEA